MTDRRYAVPFDPDYFARRAAAGEPLSPAEAFRRAWRDNHWSGGESRSGPGSGLDQTATLRAGLPVLLQQLGAVSLLDAPCGDWRWMSAVDLTGVSYTGGDLLIELIEAHQARFGGPQPPIHAARSHRLTAARGRRPSLS